MDKKIERRMYDFDIRSERIGTGERILTGRPIVYNSRTDLFYFDEVIAPGAIDETGLKDVRFLVNHDEKMIPLARSRNNNENSTMKLSVDENGLNIDWIRLDTERNLTARALESAVDRQDITGMSFMFEVSDEEWLDVDSEHPTRIIRKISNVFEVSAVTWPAYEDTEIDVRNKKALDNAKLTLESVRRSLDSDKDKLELEKEKLKWRLLSKRG